MSCELHPISKIHVYLCYCIKWVMDVIMSYHSDITCIYISYNTPLSDMASIYSKTSDTMDTPLRGQPPYNGQTACPLPLTVHTFLPPTKGQPPNNGQNACPQRVHCRVNDQSSDGSIFGRLIQAKYTWLWSLLCTH